MVACDFVGLVSGIKEPDKMAKSGLHTHKAEFVDAPVIDELPMTLECRLVSYDAATGCTVGEIVNVSADERILDADGKINPEKFEEYFKIAYGRLMNLDERLHFEFNKRLYQIPYRSIMYMESRRRVIHLIENGGQEYRFYMKMNDLMQEISRVGHMFIRIHCSYVVNYYYIKTFGASEVVLLNGEVLPVSIEYKNEAMKFYMDMAE